MPKHLISGIIALFMISLSVMAQDDVLFEPTPCPVNIPSGYVEDTGANGIECGFVTVPEFHANPDGNQIQLMVAIIHSSSPSPQTDPLFVAQGGPGGSTIGTFMPVAQLFTPMLTNRDVVLVEQRGTKYSEPALLCPEILDQALEYISVNNNLSDEMLALQIEAYQACFERLEADGVNLSAFNSVENASDMISVADALGYEAINFYGISYGTILGQHLLRDYESRVRSIIFDAVVPLEVNFMPDILQTSAEARTALFATCAADDFCNNQYPNLETTFRETYESLNANPVLVPIIDPGTGTEYDAYLDGEILVQFIRALQYSTEISPGLPAFIDATSNGDYNWFERLYGIFAIDASREIADGMFASVICAEDADFTADDIVTEGVNPSVAEAQQGSISSLIDVCERGNIQTLDDYVDEPVISDVPALIMTGQLDPVTPPRYAEILANNLSNSTNLVFPGIGHGALVGGICPLTIATEFLNDPQDTPDSDCIDDMSAHFISLTIEPTGRLQFGSPSGMDDVSTERYASYEDESRDIRLSLIVIDGTEITPAIDEALSIIIRESFSTPALMTTESDTALGIMVNQIYQDGLTFVMTFGLGMDDVTAVVVAEFPPEQIYTISDTLTPLISIMIRVD